LQRLPLITILRGLQATAALPFGRALLSTGWTLIEIR
jgi:2-keto-3-deoxy-6-phosphogluconate aldolase